MNFQDEAGNIINEYLYKYIDESKVYEKLKLEFKKSFADG